MVSIENLFIAWDYFKRGKRKRKDIQYFERFLEDFIFNLHKELVSFQYRHSTYEHFYVFDPKERYISKACVRDRLVHQMLYSTLTEVFDKTFISHSYSCRIGKGTHIGLKHLQKSLRKVSLNGERACFALKMDVRRFFDSMDHQILKNLIKKRVKDEKVLKLVDMVIDSFNVQKDGERAVGLPLGNVTSQLFANIYLHELDVFVKHHLRQKHYLRYCDDFVVVSHERSKVTSVIDPVQRFLKEELLLELHPKKIILKKLIQGIDFLGYILFLNHRLLRTQTKHRMKRRLKQKYSKYLDNEIEKTQMDQCLQSYLGILSHADQYELGLALKNAYWIRNDRKTVKNNNKFLYY
jgi:retron-type reverse transcriptase